MSLFLGFLSDSFQGAVAVVTLQLHFVCIVYSSENLEGVWAFHCVKQTQEMVY